MGDETVDPETALDADEAIRNEIRKKIRAKQRVPAFEKAGDSEYRTTANSGNAQLGTAGAAGRGVLQQGALEMSNVDLSQEFTNLVIAERGFQANSRVITTSDEILQDLVNIKH